MYEISNINAGMQNEGRWCRGERKNEFSSEFYWTVNSFINENCVFHFVHQLSVVMAAGWVYMIKHAQEPKGTERRLTDLRWVTWKGRRDKRKKSLISSEYTCSQKNSHDWMRYNSTETKRKARLQFALDVYTSAIPHIGLNTRLLIEMVKGNQN